MWARWSQKRATRFLVIQTLGRIGLAGALFVFAPNAGSDGNSALVTLVLTFCRKNPYCPIDVL